MVEVFGLSGETDLLVRVVAADAEDLYRVAGQILAIPGIDRTTRHWPCANWCLTASPHCCAALRVTAVGNRAGE
ncbi:Lrp/AsnC ligand binding domain-containing protein [Streptomyces malaysiensis]|uniref:Lrp/AsnC ligand binding domain-containing protein n=1 Tax=Streptomyces malaysiensis TaxID=92644 RepID=UPI00371A22A3